MNTIYINMNMIKENLKFIIIINTKNPSRRIPNKKKTISKHKSNNANYI